MKWFASLLAFFAPSPIHGRAGYARGRANAEAFLARNPSLEERKNMWRHVSHQRADDYDQGVRDVLQEARDRG